MRFRCGARRADTYRARLSYDWRLMTPMIICPESASLPVAGGRGKADSGRGKKALLTKGFEERMLQVWKSESRDRVAQEDKRESRARLR